MAYTLGRNPGGRLAIEGMMSGAGAGVDSTGSPQAEAPAAGAVGASSMEAMHARMEEMMVEMKSMMDAMPPEHQAMMRQKMVAMMGM